MRRTVRDVKTEHVVVARASTPFKVLVRLLGTNRVSAVPVVDEHGVLVGLVSEADLLLKEEGADQEEPKVFQSRRRRVERAKAAGAAAAEVMTTEVVTTRPDSPVAEAARLMHERGVKRL